MKCPFGGFRAEECIVRHNDAVESIENEEQCVYSLCAKCSAVKYYLKYKKDNNKPEEKKSSNSCSYVSKTGNKIIVCGTKNPAMSSIINKQHDEEVKIDSYIFDRFIKTYKIIKENNIKTYDELLRFVQYKNKTSIYIYIRDNRKGLEILFKNNPLQE